MAIPTLPSGIDSRTLYSTDFDEFTSVLDVPFEVRAGTTMPRVAGGEAYANSSNAHIALYGETLPTDQWGGLVLGDPPVGNYYVAVYLRANQDSTSYQFRAFGDRLELQVDDGNSNTTLAQYTHTPVRGDELNITAVGTEIRCYLNDVQIMVAVDTTVPSGHAGLNIKSADATVQSFACGDFVIEGGKPTITDVNSDNIIRGNEVIEINGAVLDNPISVVLDDGVNTIPLTVLDSDDANIECAAFLVIDYQLPYGLHTLRVTNAQGATEKAVTLSPAQGKGYVTVAGLGEAGPGDPPWSSQDVGSVTPAGSWSESGGTHTVVGAGADIWNYTDNMHFAYVSTTGDEEITARVVTQEDTNPYAKATLMFRENMTAGSRHVHLAVMVDYDGYLAWRDPADSNMTSGDSIDIAPLSVPTWLRLNRTGDLFTAYTSADGVSWTQRAQISLALNATLFVGMAVTSHNNGTLCTVEYDNVSLASYSGGGGVENPDWMGKGITGLQDDDQFAGPLVIGASQLTYLSDTDMRVDPAVADGTTFVQEYWSSATRTWTSRQATLNIPDSPPVGDLPPRWIATPAPPPAMVGKPYEYYFGHLLEGKRPMTFTVASGALPTGFSIENAEEKIFSDGAHTQEGEFVLSLEADNGL